MIVGASYYDQGLLVLKFTFVRYLMLQVSMPIPFRERIPSRKSKRSFFNADGNIINEGTVKFLETCLDNFVKYVGVVSKLKKPKPIEPEDLVAENQSLLLSLRLIRMIQIG